MDLKSLKDTPPWHWPEDADQMISEVLRNDSADASDRLLAAALAGGYTVINDELVEELLSVLINDDLSENLREQAAVSLGPILERADTDGFDGFDAVPIEEETFHVIRSILRRLYFDAEVPQTLRRRVLEAAVHAPETWHENAVRAAYAVDNLAWKRTAVFSMRWVRGFERQILEAMKSKDRELRCHAIYAAGNWGLDKAWKQIARLLISRRTHKSLLLAAIDAAVFIRPEEAETLLDDLAADSEDGDIIEAVYSVDWAELESEDIDDGVHPLF